MVSKINTQKMDDRLQQIKADLLNLRHEIELHPACRQEVLEELAHFEDKFVQAQSKVASIHSEALCSRSNELKEVWNSIKSDLN